MLGKEGSCSLAEIHIVNLNLPSKNTDHKDRSFDDRGKDYGEKFSRKRAINAFFDWQDQRDKKLQRCGIDLRGNIPEVSIRNLSFNDACLLAEELIGEYPEDERCLNPVRGIINDFIQSRKNPYTETGFGEIYNGLKFLEEISFKDTSTTREGHKQVYFKHFRVDYDRDKGLHINVVINPEKTSRHLRESLKIAFCFDAPKEKIKAMPNDSDSVIYSMLLWNLNYLLYDESCLQAKNIAKPIPDSDKNGQAFVESFRQGFDNYVTKIQQKIKKHQQV